MTAPAFTAALGNVNVAPGYAISPKTSDVELLASSNGGHTQDGVTLAQNGQVLAVGTPLYRYATGLYGSYNSTDVSDVTKVVGFLRHQTYTGLAANGDLPRFGLRVFKGILKYSVVKAANGGTDLTAAQLTNVGGRVDTNRDYLIVA